MYEKFEELLKKNNVTAYRVAKETGVTTATLTSWKQGKYTPKREKLQKIADYFGVGIEYFTGEGPVEETSNQGYYIDEETARTAQEIYNNDKILFDVYKTADKDRLIAYAKKLSELRKLEEGEEWLYYKGYYINVVMLDKSYGIPGCVRHNADDSYTIFIDASLNYEKQHEVFLHEMRHILGNDFVEEDVQKIEMKNHMYDYFLEISAELFPNLKNIKTMRAI